MFIADLEHLEVLSSVQHLADALLGAKLLSLSIKEGVLSLTLGDVALYSVPLADEVTGIQLSFKNVSGGNIFANCQFGNRSIRSSALASASTRGMGSSFASSSASISTSTVPVSRSFNW
jgi:hypothetical protein